MTMKTEITPEMLALVAEAAKGSVMMNPERLSCIITTLLHGDLQPGEVVVELGTFVGRSAQMMRGVLNLVGVTNDIISVDNMSIAVTEPKVIASATTQVQEWTERNLGKNILFMASTKTFLKYFSGTVGVLCIDAGHEYHDVRDDINGYVGLVKKGGTIYCDDYWGVKKFHPGVIRAVDELLKNNDNYELILEVEGGISFRKK